MCAPWTKQTAKLGGKRGGGRRGKEERKKKEEERRENTIDGEATDTQPGFKGQAEELPVGGGGATKHSRVSIKARCPQGVSPHSPPPSPAVPHPQRPVMKSYFQLKALGAEPGSSWMLSRPPAVARSSCPAQQSLFTSPGQALYPWLGVSVPGRG